jgi:hypothetical protein
VLECASSAMIVGGHNELSSSGMIADDRWRPEMVVFTLFFARCGTRREESICSQSDGVGIVHCLLEQAWFVILRKLYTSHVLRCWMPRRLVADHVFLNSGQQWRIWFMRCQFLCTINAGHRRRLVWTN